MHLLPHHPPFLLAAHTHLLRFAKILNSQHNVFDKHQIILDLRTIAVFSFECSQNKKLKVA